jgi:preprotein translocase subunit YajC
MGTMFLAASTTTKGGSSSFFLIILVVFLGIFYFVMVRPQRSRQRRAMQMQNQVVPGQRIVTTAGMYGTVVSADDQDIVIEVAPGVQISMLRRAVLRVVTDTDDASSAASGTAALDGQAAGEPEQPPADAGDAADTAPEHSGTED